MTEEIIFSVDFSIILELNPENAIKTKFYI